MFQLPKRFVSKVTLILNLCCQVLDLSLSIATGKVVDASQEMIALGICNILGSFVQSMPTCGAFSRSAVSEASGVRTPLAGIYSGTMTLLALSFLTPYFYFIPRATLGSVLICAVYFMVKHSSCVLYKSPSTLSKIFRSIKNFHRNYGKRIEGISTHGSRVFWCVSYSEWKSDSYLAFSRTFVCSYINGCDHGSKLL